MLNLFELLGKEENRSWILARGKYWKITDIKVYIDNPTQLTSFCLVVSKDKDCKYPLLFGAEIAKEFGCVTEIIVEDEIKEIVKEDVLKNCFSLVSFDQSAIEKHFNLPLTNMAIPSIKNDPRYQLRLKRQVGLVERIKEESKAENKKNETSLTPKTFFPSTENSAEQFTKKQKFETSERTDLVEHWLNSKDNLDKLKDVLIQLPEDQFNQINTTFKLASITTKTK